MPLDIGGAADDERPFASDSRYAEFDARRGEPRSRLPHTIVEYFSRTQCLRRLRPAHQQHHVAHHGGDVPRARRRQARP